MDSSLALVVALWIRDLTHLVDIHLEDIYFEDTHLEDTHIRLPGPPPNTQPLNPPPARRIKQPTSAFQHALPIEAIKCPGNHDEVRPRHGYLGVPKADVVVVTGACWNT